MISHELNAVHKPALESLDIMQVETLAGELDSWHSVDIFCVCIAGPCWCEVRKKLDTGLKHPKAQVSG